MATANDQVIKTMIDGINQRIALMTVQHSAGMAMEALLQTQTNAILQDIYTAGRIELPVCHAVTHQINGGPWTDQQKLAMAGALADGSRRAQRPAKRDQQNCPFLEQFFTESEWETFKDPSAELGTRVHAMAHRMYAIGLSCPSESTLMKAGAILIQTNDAMKSGNLNGQSKSNLCKAIQSAI